MRNRAELARAGSLADRDDVNSARARRVLFPRPASLARHRSNAMRDTLYSRAPTNRTRARARAGQGSIRHLEDQMR
jgi:hypothetical protein